MNSKRLHVIGVLLATCLTAVFAIGQSPPTPPDLSGKWTVVTDVIGSDSPLGREGTITQDESTIIFRSSTQALAIALDGSKTTSQSGSTVREYQARWVGFALAVSMKTTGSYSFEDLMVVTPGDRDTLTMVLFRTSTGPGKMMNTHTLTYKKG